MKVNNVEIEDTYAETFSTYIGRILITASTRRWALASAQEAKGLGASATMGPAEAGIEQEAQVTETPDGRPGYVLQVGHRQKEELNYWLVARIRKGVVPVPTTAAFNAMPRELTQYYIEIDGTPIRYFGDGYEEPVNLYEREVYKIPRMDGFFYIERKLGVTKGVAGGNFLILGESPAATLMAAEVAADAIREVDYVFMPCAGGVAASGTKVGGKTYKDAVATTNDPYCACIADRVKDTRIPKGVSCTYEIFVNGLSLESVKKAMRLGIKAATTVGGVKLITACNYGGKLGKTLISLHEVCRDLE